MDECCLFIGGKNDGRLMVVEPDRHELRLPVVQPIRVINFGPPSESVSFGYETYEREQFKVGRNFYSVFRHESLLIEELFERLLAGYRRQDDRDL